MINYNGKDMNAIVPMIEGTDTPALHWIVNRLNVQPTEGDHIWLMNWSIGHIQDFYFIDGKWYEAEKSMMFTTDAVFYMETIEMYANMRLCAYAEHEIGCDSRIVASLYDDRLIDVDVLLDGTWFTFENLNGEERTALYEMVYKM